MRQVMAVGGGLLALLVLGTPAGAAPGDVASDYCLESVPVPPERGTRAEPARRVRARFESGELPRLLVPMKLTDEGLPDRHGAFYDEQGRVYGPKDALLALSLRSASAGAFAAWKGAQANVDALQDEMLAGSISAGIRLGEAAAKADRALGKAICDYNRPRRTVAVDDPADDQAEAQGAFVRPPPEGLPDHLPLASGPGTLTGTLDNGLRVSIVADPSVSTVAVVHRFAIGSSHETDAQAGLAHLVEHLLHRGAVGEQGASWGVVLDAWGGVANAWTSWDDTVYFAEVAARHLDPLLTLEASRLQAPAFGPEDLPVARSVVLQELQMRGDLSPWSDSGGELTALLAGDHPYARHPGGTPSSVAGLDHADALAWVDAWMRPELAHVAIVGPVDGQAVWDRVEALYGGWEPGAKSPPAVPPVPGQRSTEEPAQVPEATVDGHYRELAAVSLPPRTAPEAARLALLLEVLLEHGSAAVNEAVMERRADQNEGITFDEWADAEATEQAPDAELGVSWGLAGGHLTLSLQREDPDDPARGAAELDRAVDALIQSDWITPAMLAAARKRIALDALRASWSPGRRALDIVADGAVGPIEVSEQLRAVREVGVEDLEALLSELLSEERRRHVVLAP